MRTGEKYLIKNKEGREQLAIRLTRNAMLLGRRVLVVVEDHQQAARLKKMGIGEIPADRVRNWMRTPFRMIDVESRFIGGDRIDEIIMLSKPADESLLVNVALSLSQDGRCTDLYC